MKLVFESATGVFDLALGPGGDLDPGIDDGGLLQSAVWVSLFSDGLADAADLTPDLGDDRRGWWGDSGEAPGHALAESLLWLYQRGKKNEKTRLAIQNTAADSLQWMADDGIVASITVTVAWLPAPREGVQMTISTPRPNGAKRDWAVDLVWSGVGT